MNLQSVQRYLLRNSLSVWTKNNVWRFMLIGAVVSGVALALLALMVLRPTLKNIDHLNQERIVWTEVISHKDANYPLTSKLLPGIEDLPEIVGVCREIFRAQGAEVISVNMESVSNRNQILAQRQSGLQTENRLPPSEALEPALFRFRVKGQWAQILAAVSEIESNETYAVHVQELILNENSGNLLLQFYYVKN